MDINHKYNLPEKGATGWHVPLNENFELLDADVEIRDAEDNLDDYTPKKDAKFLATDTGNVYLGDGKNWNALPSSGMRPTFASAQAREVNTIKSPPPSKGVAGINAAIDGPGVTVQLREGTYVANEQLKIAHDNVTIKGAGYRSPEARTGQVGDATTTIRSALDGDVVVLTNPGVKSARFVDFHVDGHRKNGDTQNAFSLNKYAPYATFENVSCKDLSGHAVVGDMVHNFRFFHLAGWNVDGYLVRNRKTGSVNSAWGTMMNCRATSAEGDRDGGIVDADSLHLTTMINCSADAVTDSAVRIRDGFLNSIIGCGVEQAHHHGFELGGRNATYNGGIIQSCWCSGAGDSGNGFHFVDVSDVTVTGNAVENFSGADLRILHGSGIQWGRNVIETVSSDPDQPFVEGETVRHGLQGAISSLDFANRERMRIQTGGGQIFYDRNGNRRFSIDRNGVSLEGQNLSNLAKYKDEAKAPTDTLYYDSKDKRVEYKDPGGQIHDLG